MKMNVIPKKSARKASRKNHVHLTLSEILFMHAARGREDRGAALLPAANYALLNQKITECAVCKEQAAQITGITLTGTGSMPAGTKTKWGITDFVRKYRIGVAAAAMITVLSSAYLVLTGFNENENIEIVSANAQIKNGDLEAGQFPLGLKLLQKKKKIGEINMSSQTRMSLVKLTGKKNKFKSTIKMHGGKADIVMSKNMQGDLLIRAGELSANVKWPKAGAVLNAKGSHFNDPFVHLRITDVKEVNEDDERVRNLHIEVLRGKVEVAQPDIPGHVTELEKGELATISLEPG